MWLVVLGVSARCCLIAALAWLGACFPGRASWGIPLLLSRLAAFPGGCSGSSQPVGGLMFLQPFLCLPVIVKENRFISLSRLNMFCTKKLKQIFFFSKPLVPRPGLSRDLCAPGFVEHMKASATHNVYVGHVLAHVLKHTSECWAWLCLHLWCPHRYNKEGFDVSQGKCKYLI